MQFSIVIPTRNRAAKLRWALRSALAQRWDDYEVLVSNNDSQDDTADEIVRARHPRLRSLRTERALSMVDHWEYVLAQARGEWIVVLCDDDALLPHSLAALADLARRHPDNQLVQFSALTYVYDDGVAADGNYVDLPERVPWFERPIDSRARLAEVFRRLSGNLPKFLNAAVRRDLVESLRARHGRIFRPWAPDFTSGSLLLSGTPRFLEVGPLMLWGENMQSYGSGSQRDPAHLMQFFREFAEFTGRLELTPYPELMTVTNAIYDTLSRIRAELGPRFTDLRIDPVRYRRYLLQDLQRYIEFGHAECRPWLARIRRDLVRQRLANLLRPSAAVAALFEAGRSLVRRLGRSAAKRLASRQKTQRMRFANIFDAAQYVGDRVATAPAAQRRAA